MCSNNRANQHAHFPDQAVACATSICRAQSPRQIMICHFILSLQTQFKCFNKTVARFVRACSSRRPSPPRLWWLQRLPLPLGRQIISRLFVLFKCVSCNGAIIFGELSWSISKPPAHANERANSVSGLKSNNAAKATMQQNI
jgi:hypothetical protein